ncbi:MAG: GNAT family N-acetyltransferase [Verrucomicrobia bacterium]|nr:GNAT family N-acetyltransferase [Verrucomicrobiota bacterium]
MDVRPVDGAELAPTAERILRALPAWFGIESSLVEYVEDVRRMPTWAAFDAARAIGFVSVRVHFPTSWEVHVLAAEEPHRRGVGRALVGAVERAARDAGARLLHVKTLGPARPNAEYARTRAFYEGVGFLPLEERLDLWAGNPCLFMVKPLD